MEADKCPRCGKVINNEDDMDWISEFGYCLACDKLLFTSEDQFEDTGFNPLNH